MAAEVLTMRQAATYLRMCGPKDDPRTQGNAARRLRRMLEFFLLNNQLRKAAEQHRLMREGVRRVLGAPLRWRLRSNRYSFPWELWVARSAVKLVTRRSLLTGQPLSTAVREVC